jgi:hypothetical protein
MIPRGGEHSLEADTGRRTLARHRRELPERLAATMFAATKLAAKIPIPVGSRPGCIIIRVPFPARRARGCDRPQKLPFPDTRGQSKASVQRWNR